MIANSKHPVPDLWTAELARTRAQRSRMQKILMAALRIALICSLVTVAGAGAASIIWLRDLGIFRMNDSMLAPITNYRPPDNSLVLDQSGNKIGEFFDTYHVYVPFEKIPKSLIDAVIAIEDRNFWTHYGYDPRGMARALLVHLKGRRFQQGASTITQQVVRQFLLTQERSIARKVNEIVLAHRLEKLLSKEKIFEIYVNASFLGNGAYGVGAASWRYFGKSIDRLTSAENALIAGLFQSPSRYNPTRWPRRAKKRQMQVIASLRAAKLISAKEMRSISAEHLKYSTYQPINTEVAPWFIDHVRDEAKRLLADKQSLIKNGGLRIYTTLDHGVQVAAEKALEFSRSHLDYIGKRAPPAPHPQTGKLIQPEIEAAVLVTDPRNGSILAMVGGRDYRRSQFNRTTQAMRSPGSAFKPVPFSLALAGRHKWSDLTFVAPVTVENYRPRSHTEDYGTETTLLRSFYKSLNAPTVELGQQLGLDQVIQHAKRLGIRSPIKNEYGSLLGSSEVQMLDLSRMYGSFASGGRLVEPTSILKIEDASGMVLWELPSVAERTTTVMSPQTAFLMTQGMRDVLSFGTGYSSAALASYAAGKTGTSNDATDNWFCGYTPDLVAIVWVGTDNNTPLIGDFTAGTVALPVWDKFMNLVLAVRPPQNFVMPANIVSAKVHANYGNLSPDGVTMFFRQGNEPKQTSSPLDALNQAGRDGYRGIFLR